MSSDPLWKYVNVRRLFIYLEHSIDRATQWAVFEPNNHTLWLKVRLTIEAFLKNALQQEKELEYWKADSAEQVKEIAYP